MKKAYLGILIIFIFIFFFLIYFLDFFSINEYTIIRNPINYKEAFVNLEPADTATSYSLLDGVLPLKEKQIAGGLNSETCFNSDFQKRLEPTRNYLQRTNNYRHKDPESCSSPYQEFVTAYYKVDPIA
jgi:hypothetical protein